MKFFNGAFNKLHVGIPFIGCMITLLFLYSPRLAILALAAFSCICFFYTPTALVYMAFFVMAINGWLRWQTGQPTTIALGLDIVVLLIYLKFFFDIIFLKKLKFFQQVPLHNMFFIFIFYSLLEIFNPGVSIAQGIMGFRFMAYYLFLYFVGFYYFSTKERLIPLLKYLFILLCGVSLYGFKQYWWGATPIELAWIKTVNASSFVAENQKIFSLLPSSQDFATLLALYIPLFFPFTFGFMQRIQRYAYAAAIVLFLVVSTFTFIRGAMLASLLALLAQCYFLWRHHYIVRAHLPRWIMSATIVIIVVIGSLQTISFGTKNVAVLVERYKTLGSIFSIVGITQNSTRMRNELYSYYERNKIWHDQLERVGFTFFGKGIGTLRTVDGNESTYMADNGWLRIYIELGFIGVILYTLVLIGFIYIFWRKVTQITIQDDDFYRLMLFATMGLLISFIAINMSSEYYEVTPAKLSFWFLMGACLGYAQQRQIHE